MESFQLTNHGQGVVPAVDIISKSNFTDTSRVDLPGTYTHRRPSAECESLPTGLTGIVVRKCIPSDHSCLFSAVFFCITGFEEANLSSDLRKLISKTVLDDPVKYNRRVLGMTNPEYAKWILLFDSSGGETELMILGVFYAVEINVMDTQYFRIKRFGEERNYTSKIFLLYDGVHYDALYLDYYDGSKIVTMFSTADTNICDQVMDLGREARGELNQSDIPGIISEAPKKFTNNIGVNSKRRRYVATTSKDTAVPAVIELDDDGWEVTPPQLDLESKSSNRLVGIATNAVRREWWNTPSRAASPMTSTLGSITRLTPSRPFVTPPRPFTASLPFSQQMNSISVIDSSWELIDPNPDIHSLFMLFNSTYFWDKLGAVTVEWSSKMTSCAGLCYFKSNRQASECRIKLSLPLLKLRPRKDLVETLLHEMIHALLFLESGARAVVDRDGHGPNFQEHMHRINRVSGAHITIYHTFYDEVRHYKQHWWQCNGPCRHRTPFFGLVKRVMNRAPGPSDRWWSQHAVTCTGVFLKVREPPKSEKENKKRNVSCTTFPNSSSI